MLDKAGARTLLERLARLAADRQLRPSGAPAAAPASIGRSSLLAARVGSCAIVRRDPDRRSIALVGSALTARTARRRASARPSGPCANAVDAGSAACELAATVRTARSSPAKQSNQTFAAARAAMRTGRSSTASHEPSIGSSACPARDVCSAIAAEPRSTGPIDAVDGPRRMSAGDLLHAERARATSRLEPTLCHRSEARHAGCERQRQLAHGRRSPGDAGTTA